MEPPPPPTPAPNDSTKKIGPGPGADPVSVTGITVVSTYLTVFAVLLLYLLVALWPVPTPSGEEPPGEPTESVSDTANARLPGPSQETTTPGTTPFAQDASTAAPQQSPESAEQVAPKPETKDNSTKSSATSRKQKQMKPVYVFCWRWNIADEVRLLMLVICAGALGSLVHGLRSVYWYVGNRELVWSWVAKYLLLPFTGAILAVLFYFVVRGGFFSPEAGFAETSPFGFAALAAMVGMFSEQAVLKLKEISETLLSKPAEGKNSEPQGVNAKPGAKT